MRNSEMLQMLQMLQSQFDVIYITQLAMKND
jgi:hypothetical protein